MKKFVIITSIFPPTEAVKKFSKLSDWQLVVVGDRKTPIDWQYENVIYLSPKKQVTVVNQFAKKLPWNSYCRKMIGYIYAIQQGAAIIADTDDDNIPYHTWGKDVPFEGTFPMINKAGFQNMYSYYSDAFVWPRGYPLDHILTSKKAALKKKQCKVGIWQELADEDPDVDAIYRLIDNTPIMFKKNGRIVLGRNSVCPINSQNTFFREELFPLLYLPVFVKFRFTDILRGLVAQPILWNAGYYLGFGEASVIQKRNPHDYLQDFSLEIPAYLYSGKVTDIITSVIRKENSIEKNMIAAYSALAKEKIVEKKEVAMLRLWLTSCKKSVSSPQKPLSR